MEPAEQRQAMLADRAAQTLILVDDRLRASKSRAGAVGGWQRAHRGGDLVARFVRDKRHDVERAVLSRAVRWHCEDRVIPCGNQTIVF